jgi:hypothetical protein
MLGRNRLPEGRADLVATLAGLEGNCTCEGGKEMKGCQCGCQEEAVAGRALEGCDRVWAGARKRREMTYRYRETCLTVWGVGGGGSGVARARPGESGSG